MNEQGQLIVKILLLSTGLSVLLKYGGRLVAIAPTSTNALIAVMILPLITGVALWWRRMKG